MATVPQTQLKDPMSVQISDPNPGFLSNLNTNVGNFLGSPTGQLATAATVGGLGYLQASQAQSQAAKLAGNITAPSQPLQNLGTGTVNQMLGGPQMPGPYGQAVAGETAATGNLTNVAQQYSTGQLTPAQQLQVQQATNRQQAGANLAFGMAGNPMSSAQMQESQQIQNNAAMLTQQLQQGNVQMAQQALQAVQQTYQNLLNPAIQAATLSTQANAEAVSLQIQQNSQISQSLNNLWGQLATGVTTANAPANQNAQDLIKRLLSANTGGGTTGGGTGSTDTGIGAGSYDPSSVSTYMSDPTFQSALSMMGPSAAGGSIDTSTNGGTPS